MGYTIRIGNGEIDACWGSEYTDPPTVRWYVREVENREAPLMPDSGRTNERCPSYTQWGNFCEAVELTDWSDTKLADHPGVARLTPGDINQIDDALVAYQRAHPESRPGLCDCTTCDDWRTTAPGDVRMAHDPLLDFNLMRLEWLAWWVRWAVRNCERPAIYNA